MKGFNSFLGCLSLEIGIIFMVIYDFLHLFYHMLVFFPKDAGRKAYIYHKAFDMDADLFLFFSTNVALLLIKIGYGIKVIQKKFKQYTNTYAVLTNLGNLLIWFLDFALAAYMAKQKGEWIGFVYTFCLLLVSIYFIMLTKSLNKKVVREREEAKIAEVESKAAPLMAPVDEVQSDEDSDENQEQSDEDNALEERHPVTNQN